LDRNKLFEGMFGSSSAPRTAVKPVATPTSGEAALKVRDLMCQGWCKPLSLTVKAGEVVGIIGLAGNKQDELVAALAGLLPTVNGSVLVGGQPRQGCDIHSWGMGCLPSDMHDSACVPSMDVAENMALHAYARPPNVRGGGWFTAWNAIRNRGEQVARDKGLSAAMAAVPLGLLSGGNQRKVLLARELAGARHALVLHNPEAGLDARAIQDLLGDLLAARDKKIGLLVLAEDFDFLEQLATRVFLIEKGELRQLTRTKWRDEARRALSGDAGQIEQEALVA
jgi:simple sugar transport system ATP-binding protein